MPVRGSVLLDVLSELNALFIWSRTTVLALIVWAVAVIFYSDSLIYFLKNDKI